MRVQKSLPVSENPIEMPAAIPDYPRAATTRERMVAVLTDGPVNDLPFGNVLLAGLLFFPTVLLAIVLFMIALVPAG